MRRSAPGSRSSLDDGKNNSRAVDDGGSGGNGSQSCSATGGSHDDDPADERYDCRHVYQNMYHEADTAREHEDEPPTAPYRCGSWDCYCCAHRMRMNLIEELDRLVEERPELRRLLTLTIDSDVPACPDEKGERHEYLTKRFNALRTELTDRYGGLSYVWIRHEGDENGRPHLHLLVDRFLPQDELSMLSQRVGLGEVVDIRRVNARNAAKYLTSYLGKGTLAGLPDGLRRYGSSQDITLDVRGDKESERSFSLKMDDYVITDDDGEPLTRGVVNSDFVRQREWNGPRPPPG